MSTQRAYEAVVYGVEPATSDAPENWVELERQTFANHRDALAWAQSWDDEDRAHGLYVYEIEPVEVDQ